MKCFTLLATLSALTLLPSCLNSDRPDLSARPVNLPKPLEFEPYFVKSTSLTQQLQNEGEATVKLKFQGSTIPSLPHNIKQGQSIAWATSQPLLADKLFHFSLSGAKASMGKREPLLEFLGNSGVRLQQIQIGQLNTNNKSPVVEDMLANKLKDPDIITIHIKRL